MTDVEKIEVQYATQRAYLLGVGATCKDEKGERIAKELQNAGYDGKLVEIVHGP